MPTRVAANVRPGKSAPKPVSADVVRRRHMASGIVSVVFFVVWLVLMVAGADMPPPAGFWIAVVVLAAITVLVYYRGMAYIAWHAEKRPGRVWRIIGEGFLAGVVVAIAIWIANAVTEPSVQATLLQRAIWLLVLGVLGLVMALAVSGADAGVYALLSRKRA